MREGSGRFSAYRVIAPLPHREGLGVGLSLPLRKRYLDVGVLLQFVAGLVHFRIGIKQLLYRQTIVTGYAEDGFLLLHLMHLTPLLGCLSIDCFCHKERDNNHQNIS